jgi:hypothetical protein
MRGLTTGLLVATILLMMFMTGFVGGATGDMDRQLDPSNETFHINQSELEEEPDRGQFSASDGPLSDLAKTKVVDYETPGFVQASILAFANGVMQAGVHSANAGIAAGSAVPAWVPNWLVTGWAKATMYASIFGLIGLQAYRAKELIGG